MNNVEMREKVIKGLKICTSRASFEKCVSDQCPFIGGSIDGNCIEMLLHNAFALLKAQEPRVMTLEEVDAINGGDVVWIEDRSLDQMIAGIKYQSPSRSCYYVMLIGSKRPQPFSKELYEVNWRCWTSRPTDEQREAVKWE